MTDKKKAKTAEVEGLIVKIGVDVDKDAIAEATAALNELATAAMAAHEALEKLAGRPAWWSKGKVVSAGGGGGGPSTVTIEY